MVAILGLVLSWILASGSTAHAVSRAVFYVGLAVWAWLELSEGVNGFRRILGAAALAWIVVSLSGEIE